jgi:hypothetical protein
MESVTKALATATGEKKALLEVEMSVFEEIMKSK